MVLLQAKAWVQYWFRVLSLKFCGKSKKICGDISPQSPAFCMYAKLLLERFPLLSWVTENLILTSYFTKKIVLTICFYDFIMQNQAKYIKYDLKSYLHLFLFELKNPMARMEVWKKFWRRPNFNPNFITSPLITKSLWASPEFNGISCPQPDIHKLKRNRDLLTVKGHPNPSSNPLKFWLLSDYN